MNDDLLPPELVLDEPPWSEQELDALAAEAEAGYDVERMRTRELAGTEQAQWAMAELARLRGLLGELKVQSDAWTARITKWYEDSTHPLKGRAAFLEDRLEHYALAMRERFDTATVKLPSGEVTTRKSAAKVVSTDDDAVIAWLKDNATQLDFDDCVRTTYELRISEVRKHVSPHVAVDDDGVVTGYVFMYDHPDHVGLNQASDLFVVPGLAIEDEKLTPKVTPASARELTP
jgi:phage host-nuclease inhibitor protein Gam